MFRLAIIKRKRKITEICISTTKDHAGGVTECPSNNKDSSENSWSKLISGLLTRNARRKTTKKAFNNKFKIRNWSIWF